jgi:hypothetical protein
MPRADSLFRAGELITCVWERVTHAAIGILTRRTKAIAFIITSCLIIR